ncbi:MAG: hypothetical protein IJV40_14230 [Oscillospiraceae bacterium]|nr:hypothetical protein [Oscillospiraceae bacterium]
MNPKLIVITGPSGAGIPELVRALLGSREDLTTVTPITARKMKEGEQNGVGFFFYDLEGWTALKESGDLLETTELAGNDYGTSRRLVLAALETGKSVILPVEPERAAQVKQNMPEAYCVYVEPADPEQLRERYARNARNSFELTARMELAKEQRASASFCDARVDSTDPSIALDDLQKLIDSL